MQDTNLDRRRAAAEDPIGGVTRRGAGDKGVPASTTTDQIIGAALRSLRGGMSQAALAEAMSALGHKWNQGTVSTAESAERPLRLSEAMALAAIFDVPLTVFAETAADVQAAQALRRVVAAKSELEAAEAALNGLRHESGNDTPIGKRSRAQGVVPPPPATGQNSVLLTLPEVAGMLRKSEAQLRWLIQNKRAPQSALVGGRRMFRPVDVQSWLDSQFITDEA